jgi:hypothetical protein
MSEVSKLKKLSSLTKVMKSAMGAKVTISGSPVKKAKLFVSKEDILKFEKVKLLDGAAKIDAENISQLLRSEMVDIGSLESKLCQVDFNALTLLRLLMIERKLAAPKIEKALRKTQSKNATDIQHGEQRKFRSEIEAAYLNKPYKNASQAAKNHLQLAKDKNSKLRKQYKEENLEKTIYEWFLGLKKAS